MIALGVALLHIWLFYAFFAYLWQRLPPLAAMLVFIGLTLLAVASPFVALTRLGSMRGRRDSEDE